VFLDIAGCVDLVEAEELFKTAANQGDAMGEFNYGIALSQHASSDSDLGSMSKYFKRAADKGLALGQINYAVFF
jgi:TPR repeat protein